MSPAALPPTQSAVEAATAVAERHGRQMTAGHDSGHGQAFAVLAGIAR